MKQELHWSFKIVAKNNYIISKDSVIPYTCIYKFTVLFVFKGKIVTKLFDSIFIVLDPVFFDRSVWVHDKLLCYLKNVSFSEFKFSILEAVLPFCD